MQTTPANWATVLAGPHKKEYKLLINGVEYGAADMQGTPVITKPLLDSPAIGRVCSATLSAVIRPKPNITIPKAARVYAYVRVTNGTLTTDWLPQGRYYVCSRSVRTNITITCRDEMIKGGRTYLDKTELEFPATHEQVVNEIASLMGVPLDARTSLLSGEGYTITELDGDALMTEVLAGIAACNGGNWIMTEAGALRLVPLASAAATPDQNLAKTHNALTDIGSAITISRVTMMDNAGEEYTEGDDTGFALYVECPYANQTVVAALGNSVSGLLYGVVYQPYRCQQMYIDPALELGDTVRLKNRMGQNIDVVLHSLSVSCNVAYTAVGESGISVETEEEYPYETAQELNDQRTIKTNQKYYGNSISRENGFMSKLDSGAFAKFNADGLEFTDENGKRCLYYDLDAGTFILDATLGADAIFTNSLYAEQGEVSELTVDRLSTSKHVRKFLLGDTSDDHYILIQDYSIKFISCTPAGLYNRLLTEDDVWLLTEDGRYLDSEMGGQASYTQAVNRYGDPLFWQQDITDAEISSEGYPYIDGVQIFTTTEDTGFPVYIYVYTELVKAEYKFEMDGEEYSPVQVWGSGTGYANNGKGFIQKMVDMFRIGYVTRTGTEESIELNDDGWVDINKTRKPLRFDFSGIEHGYFTEKIDGGDETTYTVTYDQQGRINSIRDQSGHLTEVIWE